MKLTYHQVLGVTLKANKADIRSHYLALAKTMHPDRNGGTKESNEAFAEVTQAYATLSDETARKKYETSLEILSQPCGMCGGDGHRQRGMKKAPCVKCGGTGRVF